ncbi:Trafficking protein particle complex subunit 6B [Cricetulus griseus]|uniref:Trafficking protein particle complex subunit 6B n=1 Tax=Cricetulus griseus TaxID=10029 RepID=G3IJF4_CRIGR|nr:Trafficking protein particle complex subunit 6B [Cricetulus griseus]
MGRASPLWRGPGDGGVGRGFVLQFRACGAKGGKPWSRPSHGFTKDTARFKDELDIMKFICKDFWTTVFKKQIDNLRTNHQGIYVLQDNKFRLLTQLSAGKQYLEHASKYLAFTCGLIRGGLSNLGIKSIVTAEVSSMPACKFVYLTYVLSHFSGLFLLNVEETKNAETFILVSFISHLFWNMFSLKVLTKNKN